MICGASIAKGDGSHRRCLLPSQHLGECDPRPRLELVRFPRPPAPAPALSRGQLVFGIAIALVFVFVCSLSGCDVDADPEGRTVLVGVLMFGMGWAGSRFTRRLP